MSLKVDHQKVSQEMKQTHLRVLKLTVAAIYAYPDDHPYVSAVMKLTSATGSLVNQLSSLYDAEVSCEEHKILGRLYEFDLDEEQWERAAGATLYPPKPENERRGFSKTEIVKAGDGVIGIGESLACVAGIISRYDPQHRVNLALKSARACNLAVGSHVGLSPNPATRLA